MCRPVVVIQSMNWMPRSAERLSVEKMSEFCRNICAEQEMVGPDILDISDVQTVDTKPQKILCFARNAEQDCKIRLAGGIMWKIKQIAEADFGCEERMPGEKLKCLVILENETGETRGLEVEDDWLTSQGLDEGSLWP